MIDDLERVGDALFAGVKLSSGLSISPRIRHWTETYPRGAQAGWGFQSFFGFAFVYPLHSYVQHKLATGYPVNSVLEGSNESMLFIAAARQDIRMLRIVFEAGGDPNCGSEGIVNSTAWCQVLWKMQERNIDLEAWGIMAGLFLDNGADPCALAAFSEDPAIVVLKSTFRSWDSKKTSELLAKFHEAKKRRKKMSKRKGESLGLWCFGR